MYQFNLFCVNYSLKQIVCWNCRKFCLYIIEKLIVSMKNTIVMPSHSRHPHECVDELGRDSNSLKENRVIPTSHAPVVHWDRIVGHVVTLRIKLVISEHTLEVFGGKTFKYRMYGVIAFN